MGQKVNPYGFRLGVTTEWKSRWFAERQDYVDYVIEDWNIRNLIMNFTDRDIRSALGGVAAISRKSVPTSLLPPTRMNVCESSARSSASCWSRSSSVSSSMKSVPPLA